MFGSQFLKRAGVVAALAVAVGAVGGIGAAQARGSVHIGIGVPFGGYYAPGYYAPGYYYDPPPVYYAPPPPVVYAPPPVVYAPSGAVVSASPASDAYVASNGQTCRQYQTTINVGGVPQASYGTACLQPDGTWRIVQ